MFRTFPALLAVPIVALGLLAGCGERDTTSLEPAAPAAGLSACHGKGRRPGVVPPLPRSPLP
jgi:hypothetical protein